MGKGRQRSRGNDGNAASRISNVPYGVDVPITGGVARLVDESDGSLTLFVNGVPSSTLREDPLSLDFEYMRHESAAIAAWDRARDNHAWLALHVGAAACTLPRHLLHTHPASRHIAVDVDVVLADLARRLWDLPAAPRLRVRAQDGLEALTSRGDDTLDVIVRDAFAGAVTPLHLADAVWWAQALRTLRTGGLVVANIGVVPSDDASAPDARAALDAFGTTIAVAEPAVLKRRRQGNVILIAERGATPGLADALRRYAASAPLPTGVALDWT